MSASAPAGRLGLFTLSALVAANMIGAGVFTTSGFSLDELGSPSWVMAAWVVGALIALCGALSYGALSRHVQGSGGEYLYLSRALHPLAGFLAGWVSLIAGFTGAIAFAALALESYLGPALPDLPHGTIAAGSVVLAASLHGVRLRPGVGTQNALVALKLVLIALFVAAAVWYARGALDPAANEMQSPPVRAPLRWSVFAGSLVWISLSYSGFNAAVYVAGEARDARRDVPRSMLWGTLGVSAIYLVLNAIFVLLPPESAVRGRPDIASAAAEAIGGVGLKSGVTAIISVALLTSVSSMMMAGPRVYARMAEDGLFPTRFRFRGEVPRAAIVLQGLLAIAVILISDLRGLLSYLGLTLSVSAAATAASLFVLRRRARPGEVSIPGAGWIPGFYVAATLGLALIVARSAPVQFLAMGATLLSGCIVYWRWRAHSRP